MTGSNKQHYWSIERVESDLERAVLEADQIVSSRDAGREWSSACGHLQGAIAAAVSALEYIRGRQIHTAPAPILAHEPAEKRITITVEVPVSQVEVQGEVITDSDPDEFWGQPCTRTSTAVEVTDLKVTTLPLFWEITEWDNDAAAELLEARQ